jgi:hypothetical protein
LLNYLMLRGKHCFKVMSVTCPLGLGDSLDMSVSKELQLFGIESIIMVHGLNNLCLTSGGG